MHCLNSVSDWQSRSMLTCWNGKRLEVEIVQYSAWMSAFWSFFVILHKFVWSHFLDCCDRNKNRHHLMITWKRHQLWACKLPKVVISGNLNRKCFLRYTLMWLYQQIMMDGRRKPTVGERWNRSFHQRFIKKTEFKSCWINALCELGNPCRMCHYWLKTRKNSFNFN